MRGGAGGGGATIPDICEVILETQNPFVPKNIFFSQIMVTEEVEKEKRVLAGEEQRRVISLQVVIRILIRRRTVVMRIVL